MTKTNKNNKVTVPSIISVILCVVLALGVMSVFRACGPKDDGTWMSCHYAQLMICGMALLMAFLSVLAMAFSSRTGQLFLHLIVLIAAIFTAAAVPGHIFHLCMMSEMRCRAIMRPFTILMCVMIVIFSALSMIPGKKKRGSR